MMNSKRTIVTLLALLAGMLPAWTREPAEVEVSARLELNQHFYYVGEPLFVRVSVGNDGTKKIKNPVKGPMFTEFRIRTGDGRVLERKADLAEFEPVRPASLAPGAFYGTIVDVARLFPGLDRHDEYRIVWESSGIRSNELIVQLLPKFDPSKQYEATVRTSLGEVAIQLFPQLAPIAVQAFVDMANARFYDGLLFHEVIPDRRISGGDARFTNLPRFPFTYPAERTSAPLVAGSVVMRPVSPSPPANGSPFIILLRPEPSWAGQTTLVGQVVRGLDVVQKISRLPSSQQETRPFYRPLDDFAILAVRIEEKTSETAAGTGGGR